MSSSDRGGARATRRPRHGGEEADQALPIEAVVRGYLIGSGYKDYKLHGSVCGIALPGGLANGRALPEPIFTPASKAPAGQHDENIDFEAIVKLVGREYAHSIRRIALDIYRFAADHARARDIIIADTKFEFGSRQGGQLVLDRRGADARFIALLAGCLLQARHQPAELRQAIRARLSGVAALEQKAAGAASAARHSGAHQRQLSRGAQATDGLSGSAQPCPSAGTSRRRIVPKIAQHAPSVGTRVARSALLRSPSCVTGWRGRSTSAP